MSKKKTTPFRFPKEYTEAAHKEIWLRIAEAYSIRPEYRNFEEQEITDCGICGAFTAVMETDRDSYVAIDDAFNKMQDARITWEEYGQHETPPEPEPPEGSMVYALDKAFNNEASHDYWFPIRPNVERVLDNVLYYDNSNGFSPLELKRQVDQYVINMTKEDGTIEPIKGHGIGYSYHECDLLRATLACLIAAMGKAELERIANLPDMKKKRSKR